MNDIIEQYYDVFNFPSASKLYILLQDVNHDIKTKNIEEFKKEELQISKEAKKSKKRLGHITSLQPNFLWQIDIYYLMKYYKANKGFKYILACIDIFTRKLYCIPMKNKYNDEVKLALKLSFEEAGVHPNIITSDNNATLLSNECQQVLIKHNIIHDVVPKDDHASLGLIDRVARTLKTILHKRFVKSGTTNWIDNLSTVVNQYNNTPHSAIDDIKPNDADKPENIYTIIEINLNKKNKQTTFNNPFNIDDYVRVEIPGLAKKSEGKFSNEIYTVKQVFGKRVLLSDNKIRKYDMLIKVDTPPPQNKKPDVIKRAKQEYKQENILKKEDQKQENVRETRTRGIRIDYAQFAGKKR